MKPATSHAILPEMFRLERLLLVCLVAAGCTAPNPNYLAGEGMLSDGGAVPVDAPAWDGGGGLLDAGVYDQGQDQGPPCGHLGQACCQGDEPCLSPTSSSCQGGVCQPCGKENQPCCNLVSGANACSTPGTSCDPYTGKCDRCGLPGQSCCGGNGCLNGGCCVYNTCRASSPSSSCYQSRICDEGSCQNSHGMRCGGLDESCCFGIFCTASDTLCVVGVCLACGAAGQPCCWPSSCRVPSQPSGPSDCVCQ